MIKEDYKIRDLLRKMHTDWTRLQLDSRNPAKASSKLYLEKTEKFQEEMSMPLDIRLRDYEAIIRNSGVLDWEEDIKYLRGQMTKEQPGTFGSLDTRQLKCDQRRAARKHQERPTEEQQERERSERREESERVRAFNNGGSDDEYEVDDNANDHDFVNRTRWSRESRKADIMGPISQVADAQNISVRGRLFVAAAACNANGIDLKRTNVSRTTAWRRGQQQRLKKANEIKAEFALPEKLVVHWDGKMLRLRGRIVSHRVCVYLSGVDQEVRKLLGIPEAKDGTGESEFNIVKTALDQWMVKEQIVGLVFDTTATNTGKEKGCCR